MNWSQLLDMLWKFELGDPKGKEILDGLDVDVAIPLVIKLQKSIILFTGGNVATVRDPSLYNPQMANNSFYHIWKRVRGSHRLLPFDLPPQSAQYKQHWSWIHAFNGYPTQEDYQNANTILTGLAMGDLRRTSSFAAEKYTMKSWYAPDTIYRMIHLPWKQAMDLLNPSTTEGDFGVPVSTSYEETSALVFMTYKQIWKNVNIFFIIKHNNRGVFISNFSVYDSEEEVISGGKYKINNIEVTYIEGGTVDSGIGVDRQTAFDVFMKVYYGQGVDSTKLSTDELKDLKFQRNTLLFPMKSQPGFNLVLLVECELI